MTLLLQGIDFAEDGFINSCTSTFSNALLYFIFDDCEHIRSDVLLDNKG